MPASTTATAPATPVLTLWHRWDAACSAWLPAAVAAASTSGLAGRLTVVADGRSAALAVRAAFDRHGCRGEASFTAQVWERPPTASEVASGSIVLGPGLAGLDGARYLDVAPTSSALVDLARRLADVSVPPTVHPGRKRLDDAVVVQFMGGLGNQMFQYAAGRSIADRHGGRLVADTRWYALQAQRRFELPSMRVRLDDVIACDADLSDFDGAGLRACSERGFPVNPQVLTQTPGVVLSGYFQSPAYFSDNASRIRADFTPVTPPPPWWSEAASAITGVRRAASVHVRRGDYVTNPSAHAFHGVCGLGYYREAASLLDRLADVERFFVFSDDAPWAQAHLLPALGGRATVVATPSDAEPAACVALMAQADDAVIANSTFSWWGAWLRAKAGTVVAPRPWFQDPTDTRDLLPGSWLTLDAR